MWATSAMQIHFIASGYLFAWVVIQTDPLRGHCHRGAVDARGHRDAPALPSSVPIMMSDTAFGVEWYSQVQPRGCPICGRLQSAGVSRGASPRSRPSC